MNNKSKSLGQVFTPVHIVREMLDCIGYYGPRILDMDIIDNSCGDGAFLVEAAKRYIDEYVKLGLPNDKLRTRITQRIHGLDIDDEVIEICISRLNSLLDGYITDDSKWDISACDSLVCTRYDGLMDFVVGNPPYVRVHNLNSMYNTVKSYKFASNGMTDLYLAFFELGFRMMKENGRLCYITPSSWLCSVAAREMRNYIYEKGNLKSLIDFGHHQLFNRITAYTIISFFDNANLAGKFDLYEFDGYDKKEIARNLKIEDCYIDDCFFISTIDNINIIREIKTKKHRKYTVVKNGFATLADNVFINDNIPDSPFTIHVLKASTGKWHKCFFPYDKDGILVSKDNIMCVQCIWDYICENKSLILKGKSDFQTFYQFGRTQAIGDVWKYKIAINTLIRNKNDLKINEIPSGCGVYSGLYILSDIPYCKINEILVSDNFENYIRSLKKYKSGGYYTFSSKDVEQYLNYALTKCF